MDYELSESDKQLLDQRLKPYLERIEHLEHSCQRKEMEVVVLKLAFDNILSQLVDIKDHLKKSKSRLNRPQTVKGAVVNR